MPKNFFYFNKYTQILFRYCAAGYLKFQVSSFRFQVAGKVRRGQKFSFVKIAGVFQEFVYTAYHQPIYSVSTAHHPRAVKMYYC